MLRNATREMRADLKRLHLHFRICLITVAGMGLFLSTIHNAESGEEKYNIVQIFQHPRPHLLDGFGVSVAEHRNSVLVGVPNQVDRGREAGKAFLFDRDRGKMIHEFGLTTPTDGALFGQSVALTADEVVIGSPHGLDSAGTYTGGVHIFDQDTGQHRTTILNPQPITGVFGHTLATKDNLLIVGDPQASTKSTYYTGAGYVFDVTNGELLFTLRPPNPISGKPSRFGHAVGFSESLILIGAPLEHVGSIVAGAVYGFHRHTGALRTIFANPHSTATESFGWSVAGREQTLIVGALGYQGTYREEGIAYVFDTESGTLIHTLNNPEPRDRAHFGKTVAILHNLLVVGAPGDSEEQTGVSRGAVYVFDRTSGKFLKKIVNPARPTGADDLFGGALATDADRLLVGAPFGGNDSELDAGLVYQFDLTNVELPESPRSLGKAPQLPPLQ